MTERHSLRGPPLLALLLLLSPAAASPQLPDGEMRGSSRASLSQSCQRALLRPVAGCTPEEFVERAGCSSACARGLLATQALLQGACVGAAPDVSMVVDAALKGDLVGAVCLQIDEDETTSRVLSSTTATTATTAATTTIQRGESSSTPVSSTITPVTTPSPPLDDARDTLALQPTENAAVEAGDRGRGAPADDGVDPFSVFRGGTAGRLGAGLGHAAAVACGGLFLLVR